MKKIRESKLKKLRIENRLTLREMGEICKKTPAVIWKYENGKIDMPVSVLQRISKCFRIEAGELLEPYKPIRKNNG